MIAVQRRLLTFAWMPLVYRADQQAERPNKLAESKMLNNFASISSRAGTAAQAAMIQPAKRCADNLLQKKGTGEVGSSTKEDEGKHHDDPNGLP
eukprot:1140752-Pelagomonas_calceolata.AAC.4